MLTGVDDGAEMFTSELTTPVMVNDWPMSRLAGDTLTVTLGTVSTYFRNNSGRSHNTKIAAS